MIVIMNGKFPKISQNAENLLPVKYPFKFKCRIMYKTLRYDLLYFDYCI